MLGPDDIRRVCIGAVVVCAWALLLSMLPGWALVLLARLAVLLGFGVLIWVVGGWAG